MREGEWKEYEASVGGGAGYLHVDHTSLILFCIAGYSTLHIPSSLNGSRIWALLATGRNRWETTLIWFVILTYCAPDITVDIVIQYL